MLLVLLRIGQLASGAIVLGLLSRFFYLLNDTAPADDAGAIEPNGRLIYATVIAALTIIAALIFMPPLAYSFWSWPIDFLFSVAWLAVFCLLETLTGVNTCGSGWFISYWGYYWGRWYRKGEPGIDVNRTGCSAWRTILAFSFIPIFLYLLSGFLGIYWTHEYGGVAARSKGFLR
ncbi:hypothetical protein MMYC01_201693 [Madurella mycetomatis]|uniref:MARVEL domain-containing protein n=1 Tax=Madurella mycetomatis TaxID=100816 RepID=A0A175WH48_9PEZI|nr:hypothetical protein MMYC01_201693 [Madurella mycetomatis]